VARRGPWAAGACSGNGIIFDISNPLKPTRIDEVVDKGFAYWHSATFNNDGTKVIFTDEWGGGSRPRCRVYDPKDWGANAVYDIVDGKLDFKSYYKLPAPQTDSENCVAHNGSVVPVPGILTADLSIRINWCWLGIGPHIGMMGKFTGQRLRGVWMCSHYPRANIYQKMNSQPPHSPTKAMSLTRNNNSHHKGLTDTLAGIAARLQ